MIYIANDAGSKEFAPAIRKRTTAQVCVEEMDAGDFAFKGNGPNGKILIGIERKEIGDMLSSMRTARYAGFQLIKMQRDYDLCFLQIEGLWRPGDSGALEVPVRRGGKTKWVPYRLSFSTKRNCHSTEYRYSELDKHIISLECKKNVILLRSNSKVETVWQVVNRHDWFQKPWDEHTSADPIKQQVDLALQFASPAKKFASILPGIGLKKAGLLASHFGTIENIVLATEDGFQEVEGIGAGLAAKLHEWMRTRK